LQTSSRDSKKRGSARSTAGSTADDHQLQIINQVIANSKYGRYDDEDAEVDDNDVIAKLREWGQNGFDQHLFAQSHTGMSKRNASGASIENRRRALSINCNLELNSPINKPFEDNTNIGMIISIKFAAYLQIQISRHHRSVSRQPASVLQVDENENRPIVSKLHKPPPHQHIPPTRLHRH
jgi:hypothetical protein